MDTQADAYNRQVAFMIFAQLGGKPSLVSMIGMHTPIRGERDGLHYLQFSFEGSRKFSVCQILLDSSDTYIFKLFKISHKHLTCNLVYEVSGIYEDMLAETFEQATGLLLHF